MSRSEEYFARLAERTAFLHERITGVFVPKEEQNAENNTRLLGRWLTVVAKGDIDMLTRRLALDHLSLAAAEELVGEVRLADDALRPDWLDIFRKIIVKAGKFAGEQEQAKRHPWDGEPPDPFAAVLAPFLETAGEELAGHCGKGLQLAEKNVHHAFEKCLAGRLRRLCMQALEREYKLFTLSRKPIMGFATDSSPGDADYRAFTTSLFATALCGFFDEYPVLARLVSVCIQQWVESVTEFFQRLEADLPDIAVTFGQGIPADFAVIVDGEMGISDPHNGGRTVIAVTFCSGRKLIYKPRNLSLDTAYYRLLAWMNNRTPSPEFKILKLLERENYGWVEFVEYLPCEDEAAVRRYYRRAGGMLAVLYVLGGSDAHFENVIACGEYPVFIDLEMLLEAKICSFQKPKFQSRADLVANDILAQSVLHSGFLPSWVLSPDKTAYEISGIAGSYRQTDAPSGPGRGEGDDKQWVFGSFGRTYNIPLLEEKPILPFAFEDELVAGFTAIYDCLSEDGLLSPEGILHGFSGRPFRFIFRATRIYDQLLRKLCRPDLLADVVLWSIEADILARVLLKPEVQEYFIWPLIQEEICALTRLDIPYFTGLSDDKALRLADDKVLPDFFADRAYRKVQTRIGMLGKEDRAWQADLIRASLRIRKSEDKPGPEQYYDKRGSLSAAEALRQAERLARRLAAQAIKSNNGDVSWIGYEYLPPTTAVQLQPVNFDLYSGMCGITLFMSAMANVKQQEIFFRELAIAGTNTLTKAMDDPLLCRRIVAAGIGGAVGLGSIIYGLTVSAGFLPGTSLLPAAQKAAKLLEPLIEGDRCFDVVGGAAGALLGLVKLYSVTGEEPTLELARRCAKHLLQNREKGSSGGWPTIGKPAAGFSHGQAGIAYALTRLYRFTGEEELLEAGLAAIRCENRLYAAQYKNWRDIRKPDDAPVEDKYQSTWRHGAPGIGLARLGALACLNAEIVREDMETALQLTAALPLGRNDHLCCGNFGCVDVLLTAGEKVGRKEWRQAALALAAGTLARSGADGIFRVPSGLPQFTPGLFNGVAGIGYQLLRIADPAKFPSVLLFE